MVDTKIKVQLEGPTLKPGKQSTEFIGKVILQIVIIVNAILNVFNLPSMAISPEVSLSIAGGIEAIWLIFRQWNKKRQLDAQTSIIAAQKVIELQATRSAGALREGQARHQQNLESTKFKASLEEEAMKKSGIMGKMNELMETAEKELQKAAASLEEEKEKGQPNA